MIDTTQIVQIAVAVIAAAIPAAVALRLSPWRCRAAWWMLGIYWLALCAGMIANMHIWCSEGFNLSSPCLGAADAGRLYYTTRALVLSDVSLAARGAPALFYAPFMRLFGANVATFVAVNIGTLLAALVAVGSIANRVGGARGRNFALVAMMLAMLMPYVYAMGTMPLKESPAILSMAMFALVMLRVRSGSHNPAVTAAMIVAATVIAILVRSQLIYFVAVGVAFMLSTRNRSHWAWGAVVLVALFCAARWSLWYFSDSETRIAAQYYTGEAGTSSFLADDLPTHSRYYALARIYFAFSPWLKVLCIPVLCCVQFLIPLPWTYGVSLQQSYTLAMAHFGLVWYVVGALIIYYLCTALWRSPRSLMRLALWGVFVWVGITYLTAGVVSRYTLPLLPLLLPAAAYILMQRPYPRSLKVYMGAFAALVAVALVAARLFIGQ